ncbi:MAG: geranylgeranyl reductase, partial [Ignisphaera sp.]
DATMENLWSYHIKFHKVYGAKQASLDILRMFLQRMSNSDLNFVFRSNLVNGSEVYDMGSKGDLSISIINRVKSFLTLASRPSFLAKLYRLKQFMDRAKELYLNYPSSPSGYLNWLAEEQRLFDEYRKWLAEKM